MAETNKSSEAPPLILDVTNYRTERRNIVLTVAVLTVWICFVLAVVSRSTAVALSPDSLSLEFIAPLLFIILVSVIFLVIFCLPSELKGEKEENPQGPVVIDNDVSLTYPTMGNSTT